MPLIDGVISACTNCGELASSCSDRIKATNVACCANCHHVGSQRPVSPPQLPIEAGAQWDDNYDPARVWVSFRPDVARDIIGGAEPVGLIEALQLAMANWDEQ